MPAASTLRKLARGLWIQHLKDIIAANPDLLTQLQAGADIVDLAESAVELTGDERKYLDAMPEVIKEAIRGTVITSVTQEKDVHVQFSPGYDFELRVWDHGEAIGLHLSGPYEPGKAPVRFPEGY